MLRIFARTARVRIGEYTGGSHALHVTRSARHVTRQPRVSGWTGETRPNGIPDGEARSPGDFPDDATSGCTRYRRCRRGGYRATRHPQVNIAGREKVRFHT